MPEEIAQSLRTLRQAIFIGARFSDVVTGVAQAEASLLHKGWTRYNAQTVLKHERLVSRTACLQLTVV
jgi:hypothetical protein